MISNISIESVFYQNTGGCQYTFCVVSRSFIRLVLMFLYHLVYSKTPFLIQFHFCCAANLTFAFHFYHLFQSEVRVAFFFHGFEIQLLLLCYPFLSFISNLRYNKFFWRLPYHADFFRCSVPYYCFQIELRFVSWSSNWVLEVVYESGSYSCKGNNADNGRKCVP